MANQYVNKVVYNGNTLIDLTGDTITASDVINSKKFHDKSGASVTGTCSYDANTSDATASASEILNTKTAYVSGVKVTGTMPNRGKATGTISTKTGTYTIQNGYHDGSGSVGISSTEQAKIVGVNIRKGVTILGVEGTLEEDTENPETLDDITPTASAQTFTPSTGYTCFRQVKVLAVPYSETDNTAGGKTATIL